VHEPGLLTALPQPIAALAADELGMTRHRSVSPACSWWQGNETGHMPKHRVILLFLLVLTATAMDPTLPPADNHAPRIISALGSYEHYRRIKIEVKGSAALIGKTVSLLAGRDAQILDHAVFVAHADGALAYVTIPLPPFGKPYPPLSCRVDGVPDHLAEVRDSDDQRRSWLLEMPFEFSPEVFVGEDFPSCDYAQGELAEHLLGTYTCTATFYASDMHHVTTATQVGRYGAVVDIAAANGMHFQRFVTLYRQLGNPKWLLFDPHLNMILPDSIGVDPAVVKEQLAALGESLKYQFMWMPDNDGLAPLLAWLHACKPGSGPLPWRLGPDACDARWWFTLKKRLGLLHHRYLTFLPTTFAEHPAGPYPMLIYLHGSGHRGFDFANVMRSGPHKYLIEHGNPFILIEPQCLPGEGWEPSTIVDLANEVCAHQPVDRQRIYLTGLSMGGNGSWACAMEYPQYFAAVAPICGGCDTTDALRMKDVPTWVFHGGMDPRVPVEVSRNMVAALEACGGKPRITVYPDGGHNVSDRVYRTPEFYRWLLEQHLPTPPSEPIPK
jgi:predicted esterase